MPDSADTVALWHPEGLRAALFGQSIFGWPETIQASIIGNAMRTLLLLRHAKSSSDDPKLTDHERPLNKRGLKSAPRIGQLIQAEGLIPDLVLTSSARRALETTRAVVETSGYDGLVEVRRELYLAEPAAYVSVLSQLKDERQRVLVVGHNPGMEELVELLTGQPEHFPTAALAAIELPVEAWAELRVPMRAKLLGLWRPRELDGG